MIIYTWLTEFSSTTYSLKRILILCPFSIHFEFFIFDTNWRFYYNNVMSCSILSIFFLFSIYTITPFCDFIHCTRHKTFHFWILTQLFVFFFINLYNTNNNASIVLTSWKSCIYSIFEYLCTIYKVFLYIYTTSLYWTVVCR